MRDDHIFIMAPPRSGTKMLARALARCPDTYLITEHKKKQSVPEETNRRADRDFWQQTFGLKQLPLEEVAFDADAFDGINALWSVNAEGKRLIIKNPNNVVRAREIRQAFPRAQFVWLLRNPWAVIQSMFGGRDTGKKMPMFLGASSVLQFADPFLRAAASWAYAVDMMKAVQTAADTSTRYEDLVLNPEPELRRLAGHLGLTLTEEAVAIPRWRREDFRVARYLLRRSPEREKALQLLEPVASELGYPLRPPGFPGDDRLFAMHYLMTVISRPTKSAPYDVPRLARVAGLAAKSVLAKVRRPR
jgi:hypothetical protein